MAKPTTKKSKHYVNSAELEEWWQGWINTRCEHAWDHMSNMIHRICSGIATKFNPKDEDELHDLIHDAWVQTMDKIKTGKLRFTHGKAPVFNLITTTVFRILYSKMNKQKRQREHHKKYTYRYVQEKAPELLPVLENPGREMCASASTDS